MNVAGRVGELVGGRFRIDEELGRGGMGIVYSATHLELGEPVALKFLHAWMQTPELVARFKREAVALARLRHPGVVSLLEFGEDRDGSRFLVMELVRGETLASVTERGAIPLPLLHRIFDEILDVLEAAHAEGIIHRDLKSSNVMVVPPEHIKVLDFGLASLPDMVAEKLTESGIVQGTPEYMSPEQCHGEPAVAASDVYSLGVMLYEALVGRLPFHEGSAADIMARHMFVDPEPPARRDGAPLPPGLVSLVMAALRKEAAERPTAAALRRDLAFVAKGTDVASLAQVAARERARVAALSRSERAFTRRGTSGGRPEPAGAAGVLVSVSTRVRAKALETTLALGGIRVRRAPLDPDDDARVDVVVVSARDPGGVADRVKAARSANLGALVLVVDVSEAAEATLAIRAGAADIATTRDGDTDLARRISSLRRTHVSR